MNKVADGSKHNKLEVVRRRQRYCKYVVLLEYLIWVQVSRESHTPTFFGLFALNMAVAGQ